MICGIDKTNIIILDENQTSTSSFGFKGSLGTHTVKPSALATGQSKKSRHEYSVT
jgi:hypothetical protein